jgi:uncharacterized integral membrane protein
MTIFGQKPKNKPSPKEPKTLDLSENNSHLPASFDRIIETISTLMTSDDLKAIHFESEKLAYFYIETIVDLKRMHEDVVSKLVQIAETPAKWKLLLGGGVLREQIGDILTDLLTGSVIIAHHSFGGQVISIPQTAIITRAVEQPTIEKVLLGAKESYVENLDMNISLLRRWVKDANLTINYFTVGERSRTKVALVYFRDVVNPEWVEEITKNIKKINISRIIGHKDLMELIIGRNQTVFPLYELTELPIRTAFFVNEGRIAILLEGSPFAALLPTIVLNMFQGSEYLFQGSIISSFVRCIRMLATFLTLYAPALYVALLSVDTGIIPTELGVTIASDRAGIPYSVLVEAILLFLILDIFLEATSFVPGVIGPALNIVGSLIIGQAAAQAHLASQVAIIAAAVTAVGTFLTMYQLSYALRIWKYPMIISASLLGVYGIVCCTILMTAHLAGLKSLGTPFLTPIAPFIPKDLANGLLLHDISDQKQRLQNKKVRDKSMQAGEPDS